MGKKIHNIQSLRAVAALSILFFHIMLMEKKWGSGNIVLPELLNLGASGVDLFFVISGFVIVTSTHGTFKKKNTLVRFVYNRLSRIYPLYWFYSFILLCIFFIRPELINPTQGNHVNIVESFLLLPQNILPLLMVGWPLIHEMYFYIVFTIFLTIPEKHILKFLLMWGIIIIFGNVITTDPHLFSFNPYVIIIFNPLTLEFIAGCLIAIAIHQGINRYGSIILGTSICFIVCTGGLYYVDPLIPIFDPRLRIFLFGIPYSLMVYGAVAMEKNEGKSLLKPLRKIGDQSYSLYLSHTLVINGIGWIWIYLGISDYKYHLFWIILMLISSVITGYFSYVLLEKPIIIALKKLSKNF